MNENTIVKLNLLSDSVVCSEIVSEIEYWNTYYSIYNKCIKAYSRKTLSKKEFEDIIVKESSADFVCDIISELESKNIIDDNRYKKMYISSYEENIKYSSYKIIQNLNDLNISVNEEEVEYLKSMDFEKAGKIVKSLCAKTSNKSNYEIINACKVKLRSYLYSFDIIESAMSCIDYNEEDALRKSFNKLVKTYPIDKVIKKLYSKGYDYEKIMAMKEELDD